MTLSAYHETVFKSLQDMRSVKPVIMVLTIPSRIHLIDTIVNAIGFRAVYPELTSDTIKLLKTSSQGVVIDIVAFLTQKDTKILDILGKNFIAKYGIINICDSVTLYNNPYYITVLKNILKYQASLCVVHHALPFDIIYPVIQKSSQSLLSFKQSKKISVLNPLVADDALYSVNHAYIKIIGLDNLNHALNCPSILYAVLAAALMTVNNDADMSGLGSAVLLRAASRRAISVTNGPGSYMPIFIDSLFHLKRDYIYQIQCENNTHKPEHDSFLKVSA